MPYVDREAPVVDPIESIEARLLRSDLDLAFSREETRVSRAETAVSRDETALSRAETQLSREETRAALVHVAHLEAALRTARCIGMAMGVLMARRGLTEAAAFDVLADASQRSNRKLRDVADDVVLTGDL